MGRFSFRSKATLASTDKTPKELTYGIPRRYLCSAKYTSGEGDSRYLIRELTSSLTGEGLRKAVVELFLKDLENPLVAARLSKEAKTEEQRQELRRVFLGGKFEDLTIDSMEKNNQKTWD